jgi:hypothetical protein
VRRLGWGVGYAIMGGFGVLSLVVLPGVDPADRLDTAFVGSLLALIGLGGLLVVGFVPWYDRYRPGPVLATAPSGAPATFFRRSRFLPVVSVLMTTGLTCWSGVLSGVLLRHGHPVWASSLAAFALLLCWPLVVALSGGVRVGGLWLTPAGLEYRKEAVAWTLGWPDLARVDPEAAGVTTGVLPSPSGGGVRAVQPVVLVLRVGARPVVRRTARWVWNRECDGPIGTVCVDCVDLAGGSELIAGMIERCVAYPALRAQLGTAASLPGASTARITPPRW